MKFVNKNIRYETQDNRYETQDGRYEIIRLNRPFDRLRVEGK
jgi:hypothetical protein